MTHPLTDEEILNLAASYKFDVYVIPYNEEIMEEELLAFSKKLLEKAMRPQEDK
jgi:hypothetical protein